MKLAGDERASLAGHITVLAQEPGVDRNPEQLGRTVPRDVDPAIAVAMAQQLRDGDFG